MKDDQDKRKPFAGKVSGGGTTRVEECSITGWLAVRVRWDSLKHGLTVLLFVLVVLQVLFYSKTFSIQSDILSKLRSVS